MNFQNLSKRNRQKGTALIIAIGLLAVLSILGSVILTVTSRDLGLTAGFLPSRQNFYTADRAVEYSMNPKLLFVMEEDGDSINLGTDAAEFVDVGVLATTHKDIIEEIGGGTLTSGKITRIKDLPAEALPTTEGLSEGAWEGAIFLIEVESTNSRGENSRIDSTVKGLRFTASTSAIEDTTL